MTLTTFPASLKAVSGDNFTDYHHFVLGDGVIWAFSKVYHEQKSFNWGHRVVHKGGYAVPFCLKSNTWGKPIEFTPVFEEENSEEVLFEINKVPHLLITAGFGELTVHGLYKWTGSSWENVPLATPENLIKFSEKVNVRPVILDSKSITDRYLVFSVSHNLHLYHLKLSGSAILEPVGLVPVEQLAVIMPLAVSGVVFGSRVIISYMIHGCGYMWSPDRFIIYDTETRSFDHLNCVETANDKLPPFGQSGGGTATGLSPNGEWIHAAGSSRYGMCDSRHQGGVWILKNLDGELAWEQTSLEIPEELAYGGVIDSSTGEIYAIGKESVGKLTL